MSTNIVYNGVTYTIPATDDVAWGDAVSNFLIAIPSGMLTKVGGSWALTGSDLDLGSAYGIASIYFKTKTSTPALSGVVRLAHADAIAWRSLLNNKDFVLMPDASNMLTWDSIALVDISSAQTLTGKTINAPDNTITNIKNVNIASDAAIAYSKLAIGPADIPWTAVDTTGKIKDVDVASDAAIAGSKVDPDFGTQSVKLGSTFKVSLTGDPTEDYGIELPKANGTAGQALIKSVAGGLEWASVPGLSLNQYHIIVGNSSNATVDVDTDTNGDVMVDETNGATIKSDKITNDMINSAAAIAFSKLEALPLPLTGGTLSGLLNLDEEGIRFDTVNATPGSIAIGQTYWDDQDKTIATKLNADVSLQHGQEMHIYVLNDSGAPIADGDVVYINSANPARATIRKAQANSASTADLTIGMATQNISDSSYGYVTTFGLVRGLTTNVDSDAQAVTDGTTIYLSATTAGGWVKDAPSAPNHRVRIGQVLNAGGGTSGTILVAVEHGSHFDELHDVKITGVANNDTVVYDSSAGYWKNRADVKQYTLEETGFVAPSAVTVSYDKLTKKITLSHASNVVYLYHGVKVSLGASYTSTAHGTDLDKKYFLYFDSTGTEQWFESFQGFEYGVYVAQVNYGTTHKFAIRECHGLMQWQVWAELHRTIGTYIVSGGLVPAASWTANTYTTAAVTPAVEESVIADEDLPTTVPALVDGGTYTRLHFDSGVAVLTTGSTLPFPNDGTNIQYNQNPSSGTALTAITTNARFVNVYCVHVPAAADTDSQVYRHLFLTGQQIYTSLAAAQGEDFRTIVTGDLAASFPEFIPYARITYERQTAGGSATTFNARIPTNGVSYLVGNKAALASVSGFTPTDHNTLTGRSDPDSHPASAITGTAVTLAGSEVVTNKDLDGGTASNTSRLTVPKNTTSNLSALNRKEATLVYDTTTKKLNIDDGSSLKVVGGGLITEYKAFAGGDFTAEAGKHYIVDMAGANALRTITLPTGAAESVVRVTCINNDSQTYPLTVARGSTNTIFYNDTENTTVSFPYIEQWAEFSYTVTGTHWVVNDGSTPLSGTFSGALTVTGAFTPSGGIVGKTDGVAVAAGYVGEYKEFSGLGYANRGATLTDGEEIGNGTTRITLKKGVYLMLAGISTSAAGCYFIPSFSTVTGTTILSMPLVSGEACVTPSPANTVASNYLAYVIVYSDDTVICMKATNLIGTGGDHWSYNAGAIRIA